MARTRLFERIGDDRSGRLRQLDGNDENEVVASVILHLHRLLNTRRGNVLIADDYGLPDFNDLANRFPDAIFILKNEIRKCIEKFEPRLENVRVQFVRDNDRPLSLKYEINATIVFDDHSRNVNIETNIDASGRVNLKS